MAHYLAQAPMRFECYRIPWDDERSPPTVIQQQADDDQPRHTVAGHQLDLAVATISEAQPAIPLVQAQRHDGVSGVAQPMLAQ